MALGIVRRGKGFHCGVDRDFAPRLSFAEHVQADARDDGREPAGEVVDAGSAATDEPNKGLLDRVVRLGL